MSRPTVSVVVPAWRAARTVGRAVESLLAQTRPPDEILVIDDGSPDDLAAALRPYGDRLTLIRKANGGAASARNVGIDRARGDLLAFLDADDYWEPEKLARQLELLARYPEVGLTAGRYFTEEPGKPRTPPPTPPSAFHDRVLQPGGGDVLAVAKQIWTTTVLVRRDLLGGRRFDEGLTTAEDIDLWIRLLLAYPVHLSSEPLATCVLEAGSLSRSDVDSDCRNMLTVVRRYAAVLGKRGVRAGEAAVYREWAAGHLGQGAPAAALRPAWRRTLRQPWSAEALWVLAKAALGSCGLWPARHRLARS